MFDFVDVCNVRTHTLIRNKRASARKGANFEFLLPSNMKIESKKLERTIFRNRNVEKQDKIGVNRLACPSIL